MSPAGGAPSFGAKGTSSVDYEQQAKLRSRVTHLGPAKRRPALILQMDTVSRQVCADSGSDVIMDGDGAEKILAILRGYFAPEAAESAR